MYRKIDFSTDYKDEQGLQYYRPPTVGIAHLLKEFYFDDFNFGFTLDCLVLKVFITPVFQRAGYFLGERKGEKKLLVTVIWDIDLNKLRLIKEYEERNNDNELTIPDIIFSCLRPCDIVEIVRPEKNSDGKTCLAKYFAYKSKIEQHIKIKKEKYTPDERAFDKSLFYRKEYPYKRKGKNYGKQRTTKIRR